MVYTHSKMELFYPMHFSRNCRVLEWFNKCNFNICIWANTNTLLDSSLLPRGFSQQKAGICKKKRIDSVACLFFGEKLFNLASDLPVICSRATHYERTRFKTCWQQSCYNLTQRTSLFNHYNFFTICYKLVNNMWDFIWDTWEILYIILVPVVVSTK